MKVRHFFVPVGFIVVMLTGVWGWQRETHVSAATPPPPGIEAPIPGDVPPTGALAQAVQEAVASRQDLPGFQINQIALDNITYSADQETALIYLAALDPETNEPIAREPGLAIAHRSVYSSQGGDAPSDWQITFQADPSWQSEFDSLPPDLLTEDLSERFSPIAGEISTEAVNTLGGYLLPWAGGQTKSLTWSVGHQSCSGTACLYAFDFADGTMFPLLAAKGGTVFAAKWDIPNNSTAGTNYLILQDNSTSPVSYQIYYHLAQNSIPAELRIKGTSVRQGQYIGNADDTGYSSGHHLHFMVHTNPYGLWGNSVDITFRDVSINYDPVTKGGRPRLPWEASQFPQYGTQGQEKYTSGNYGTQPPTGGITAPQDWLNLTTNTIRVEGWGSDDLGVTKAQLLVNYGGGWRTAGTPVAFSASPKDVKFSLDVNLCYEGVQDGPVNISIRLWDLEGNQSTQPLGTRQIFKNSGCSGGRLTTLCKPSSSQVALFSQPYYLGYCQIFDVGDYLNDLALGNIGEDAAYSLQVGGNVTATLFQDSGLRGRAETFSIPDPNLADHRVGAGTTSSLRVSYTSTKPGKPGITPIGTLTANNSALFGFTNTGGTQQFTAQLSGPTSLNLPARSTAFWSVGNLLAGAYTLKVQAVSGSQSSDWASTNFNVAAGTSSLPAPVSFPTQDTFETEGAPGWTSSGAWGWSSVTGKDGSQTHAWKFNAASACQDGKVCSGDLTSPPIKLPADQAAYLRFDYQWTGEVPSPYWDQRLVQIATSDSVGGPYSVFTDLYRLSNDQPDMWLAAPLVKGPGYFNLNDIPDIKGKFVRIRFSFQSVDGQNNQTSTWTIDNFSISATLPAGAGAPDSNSYSPTSSASIPIAPGTTLQGVISPDGDADFYNFTANPGEIFQVDVTTHWDGSTSTLDPMVAIVDWEQISYIAENDDILPGVNSDARVSFIAQHVDPQGSNMYYIRVKGWDYPNGSEDRSYRITLTRLSDYSKPSLSALPQLTNGYFSGAPALIAAQASDDAPTGIKSVDFYFHRNDWENGHWERIGGGSQGNGIYTVDFDPRTIPEGTGYAFWVRASDWALNYTDQIFWNLGYDATPPLSSLNILPASIPGNTVPLFAYTSEFGSGIDRCEIQFQMDGGDWQEVTRPAGNPGCQTWFTGQFGHSYAFRARAIDRAGNAEAFPSAPETTTQMVDPGQGDTLESDNNADNAKPLMVDSIGSTHDFYGAGDEDWSWFEAQAGKQYYILVQPASGSPAGVEIDLFIPGIAEPVASAQPDQLGKAVSLTWNSTLNGRVNIRMRSIIPQVAGSNTGYTAQVVTALRRFFPIVIQ